MKRMIILGAGISGLSAAWHLKKVFGEHINLILLEKSSRPGGLIQTVNKDGFLFELGPRSCRPQGIGASTLELIEDLEIQNQVLLPDASANDRYVCLDQQLHRLPKNIFSLMTSPFLSMILKGFWNDLWTPPSTLLDETIHSFFSRRMCSEIADTLTDPLTLGIYAGDSRRLSIRSCFPDLYQSEREHSGILRGLFHRNKNRQANQSPFIRKMQKSPLYSFKDGMETLPKALYKQLESFVRFNSEVKGIEIKENSVEITLSEGNILTGDLLISTLPALQLAGLLPPLHGLLSKISYSSLAVVNFGYRKPVLTKKGFGYLIPSTEKEHTLGVVWDSCIFPQQNTSPQDTRLTVMMGGMSHPEIIDLPDPDLIKIALKSLHAQLSITQEPDTSMVYRARSVIPQYLLGHSTLVQEIQQQCDSVFPKIHLLGTSFNGVSVNQCVDDAKQLANRLKLHFK